MQLKHSSLTQAAHRAVAAVAGKHAGIGQLGPLLAELGQVITPAGNKDNKAKVTAPASFEQLESP